MADNTSKLTDPRVEPPDQPQTTKIEAPPQWAQELSKNVTFIRVNVETLHSEFSTLRVDVRSLQQWRLDEERRRDASVAPPPLTSVRVGEIVDVRASQMNMEQDARIAALLVEKDAKIAKLEAESATKEDVAKLLEDAAKVQTEAIVEGVNTIMKTPTAQKLKGAIVPVLMAAIALIGIKLQASLTKLEERPVTPTVVQLAPVTVYADAGADK